MPGRPHLTSIKGFPPDLVAGLLAEALAVPGQTPVLGISGLPGSGKSTLARQLVALARTRGLHVVALSLDDFYRTRRERLALAREVHPLLATRGPPGSHDLALAGATIDGLRRLRGQQAQTIPRFDKLTDRRMSPSRWPRVVGRPDLIVLEGWCLGVPPDDEAALRKPVNRLEADEDRDGVWRRHCNRALADYAPLWRRLDRLVFLQPPSIDIVPRWRGQQERQMQAARPQQQTMTRAEIVRFLQLFERVGRRALATLPALADRIIALDARRRPRT